MTDRELIKPQGMTAIVRDKIVYIQSINTRLKIALVSLYEDGKKAFPLTGADYECIKHIRATN
jgi:hypothetical protein